MKNLLNRCFARYQKPEANAWLRLHTLMWSLEDVILPALLIDMYEREMRDILSVSERDNRLVATGSTNK